jgi:hypothetical protein
MTAMAFPMATRCFSPPEIFRGCGEQVFSGRYGTPGDLLDPRVGMGFVTLPE